MISNIKSKSGSTCPITGPRRWQFRQGWNDARAGKGFPREYDSWSRKEQTYYESARNMALYVKLSMGAIGPAPTTSTLYNLISDYAAEAGFFKDWQAIRDAAAERNAQIEELAEFGPVEVY